MKLPSSDLIAVHCANEGFGDGMLQVSRYFTTVLDYVDHHPELHHTTHSMIAQKSSTASSVLRPRWGSTCLILMYGSQTHTGPDGEFRVKSSCMLFGTHLYGSDDAALDKYKSIVDTACRLVRIESSPGNPDTCVLYGSRMLLR